MAIEDKIDFQAQRVCFGVLKRSRSGGGGGDGGGGDDGGDRGAGVVVVLNGSVQREDFDLLL